LAAHDLGLPIERQMIGIFGDQHMGYGRFRRQACLDQPCWSRGLNDAVGASTACIFGTTGDDDAELRRDDVQPLRDILANAMQATAAAADQAFRLDDLFDTGKMLRKRAAIGRAGLGDSVPSLRGCLLFGMDNCHGRFQVFQRQIELVGISLLGLAPEGCLLEGRDQLLKPFNPIFLPRYMPVFANRVCLRCNQHRLQGGNIIGKIGGIEHS
jgi:hypothetical protein